MKSNTGQAFWHTLGTFSSFAFGIVISAILSRLLDKSDYGTYRQVLYVYNSLLVIFSVGLPKAYSYFLAKVEHRVRNDIISKLTKLLLIFGALFSISLYYGSPFIASALNNSDLSKGLQLFSPIPFLLLPTLGIEGVYATIRKTHITAIYHFSTKLIMVIAVILPVYLVEKSYEMAIYGWLIASAFSFSVALMLKYNPFPNNGISARYSYKDIFTYSLPLMTASLYGIAFRTADKFYISRYFGEELFAEYINGFVKLPFVTIIASSVGTILLPIFSKKMEGKSKNDEILELWRNSWKKSAILVFPLLIFFFGYADNVIEILYSSKYLSSTVYFRLAILMGFFNVIQFVPIILAMGETKYYAFVHSIIALLVWPLGYCIVLIGGSPFLFGVLFVSLEIIKSIWFMYFIANKMEWTFISLVPFKYLFKINIHGLICLSFVMLIFNKLIGLNYIMEIFFAFLIYAILLITTANYFGLNYLSTFKTLLNNKFR